MDTNSDDAELTDILTRLDSSDASIERWTKHCQPYMTFMDYWYNGSLTVATVIVNFLDHKLPETSFLRQLLLCFSPLNFSVPSYWAECMVGY